MSALRSKVLVMLILAATLQAAEPTSRELMIQRLIELADDPDPRVRFQTALTLGEVDSPRRIEALAKIARRDCADRWVRTAILTSVSDDADNLLADLMADESVPPEGLTTLAEGLGSVVGARGQSAEIASIIQIASETGNGVAAASVAAGLRGILSGIKLNEGLKPRLPESATALAMLQAEPFFDEIRASAVKLSEVIETGRADSHASALVSDLLRAAIKSESDSRSDAERLVPLASLHLAATNSSEDWSSLESLLAPSESDEFRIGLLAALRNVETTAPHQIVVARFGGFSPAVREKALDDLFSRRERIGLFLDAVESGAIKANKLDASRRAQLLKYPDPEIADRAVGALEVAPESGTFDLYEKYKSATQMDGNAARGGEIHKARCMQCHRASGIGHDVGPNWVSFRANPPDTVLLNLLYPSLNILPGFTQYVIELNNGRVAMGIIAASTPSSIVLRRGGGEEETILRRNIKSMSDTALSIMPEGLEDGLTHQDIADLLAFIQSAE